MPDHSIGSSSATRRGALRTPATSGSRARLGRPVSAILVGGACSRPWPTGTASPPRARRTTSATITLASPGAAPRRRTPTDADPHRRVARPRPARPRRQRDRRSRDPAGRRHARRRRQRRPPRRRLGGGGGDSGGGNGGGGTGGGGDGTRRRRAAPTRDVGQRRQHPGQRRSSDFNGPTRCRRRSGPALRRRTTLPTGRRTAEDGDSDRDGVRNASRSRRGPTDRPGLRAARPRTWTTDKDGRSPTSGGGARHRPAHV